MLNLLLNVESLHLRLNTLLSHRRPKPTISTRIGIPRPRTIRHGFPAVRRPHINWLRILTGPRVHANINRGIQPILNSLANEADLHDGIVAALLTHVEEHVLGVEGLSLVIGVVWGSLFDLAQEVLLDIELANVRDCTALNGVVGEEFRAVMDDGLDGI
jgi:hypothetical protein